MKIIVFFVCDKFVVKQSKSTGVYCKSTQKPSLKKSKRNAAQMFNLVVDINVEEIHVYETIPREDITEEVTQLFQKLVSNLFCH